MKTFIQKIKRFTATTTIVGVYLIGFGISQSQAGITDSGSLDRKHMPATMCQATTSTAFADPVYSFSGSIKNQNSSKLLELICPLQRDNTNTNTGLSYVQVFYNDRHSTKDITCDIWARESDGDVVQISNDQSSVGTGKGAILFSSTPVTSKSFNTYYIVRCAIPEMDNGNDSLIQSIFWRENS